MDAAGTASQKKGKLMNTRVKVRMNRIMIVVCGLSVILSPSSCLSGSSEEAISGQVAVVTGSPSTVEVTSWDLSLQADLPNNRLKIKARCAIQNRGNAPVERLDFDLMGAEDFYGVEVEVQKVTKLAGGREEAVDFRRFMEEQPPTPSQARTHAYPEITSLLLSPALKQAEECQFVLDYTITCLDITKRRHYNLIWEPEPARKEVCLIVDFA